MEPIEELLHTFIKHAEKADKTHQEWVKEWRKDCSNDPLPEYMRDEFNLPKALALICQEILDLKK